MENMWQHPKWPMFAFRELTCCLPSMITNISLSKYPYTSVYHDRQHPESAKMLGVHSDSGTQSTLLQEIGVQHSWLHAQPQLDTCAICLQSMCSTVSSISYILQNYSNHCHCSSNYHGGRGTNDLAEPYIYIYIMVQRHPFGFWDRWSLVAPAASLDFCIRFIRLLHPLGRITTWSRSNAAI